MADWFGRCIRNFEKCVKTQYARKPMRYLEIGVFDGDSLVWMMENVVTHQRSRAWAVDPWLPLQPRRTSQTMTDKYLAVSARCKKFGKRAKIARECSSVFLRRTPFQPHYFDVIFIDWDHEDLCFVDDFVLCWPLLRVGGVLMVDDYHTVKVKEHQVKSAFDVILPIYARFLEQICDGLPVGYKKIEDIELTTSPRDGAAKYIGIRTISSK